MSAYLSSIIRQDRSVLLYAFSTCAFGLGVMGVSAVLSNLYLIKLGFDLEYIAVLNGVAMGSFGLMSFPAGWIGLRFGLRGSMILGYFLMSLFLAIFLSLPRFLPAYQTAGMLVSICLTYAAGALVLVNSSPYLMAVCPAKDRHIAFTFQTAIMTLFAFVGALIAGFLPNFLIQQSGGRLSEAGADNSVFWLNVIGYFCAGLLMRGAHPAPPPVRVEQTAEKAGAPAGLLIFMGFLFILQYSSENSLFMLFNIYLSRDLLVTTSLIGIIFGAAQLLPALLSPVLPGSLNRWGAGRTMSGGYLLVAAGALAMFLVPSWAVAVVVYFLVRLVTNFANTARNLYSQESVQPQWRTAAAAVVTVSMTAGSVVVGFGANRLLGAAGFRGLFLGGAVLAAVSIVVYAERAYLHRRGRRNAQAVQTSVSR